VALEGGLPVALGFESLYFPVPCFQKKLTTADNALPVVATMYSVA
jgi:hypothetical protein